MLFSPTWTHKRLMYIICHVSFNIRGTCNLRRIWHVVNNMNIVSSQVMQWICTWYHIWVCITKYKSLCKRHSHPIPQQILLHCPSTQQNVHIPWARQKRQAGTGDSFFMLGTETRVTRNCLRETQGYDLTQTRESVAKTEFPEKCNHFACTSVPLL